MSISMGGGDKQIVVCTQQYELLMHITTWMHLKLIMLSERSQTQKEYTPYNSIYMKF